MQHRNGSGADRLKTGYITNSVVPNEVYNNLPRSNAGKEYDPNNRNPSSVQLFNNRDGNNGLHTTQKPVALIEYLVRTYTQEDEVVLDFTAGSFTTAIA